MTKWLSVTEKNIFCSLIPVLQMKSSGSVWGKLQIRTATGNRYITVYMYTCSYIYVRTCAAYTSQLHVSCFCQTAWPWCLDFRKYLCILDTQASIQKDRITASNTLPHYNAGLSAPNTYCNRQWIYHCIGVHLQLHTVYVHALHTPLSYTCPVSAWLPDLDALISESICASLTHKRPFRRIVSQLPMWTQEYITILQCWAFGMVTYSSFALLLLKFTGLCQLLTSREMLWEEVIYMVTKWRRHKHVCKQSKHCDWLCYKNGSLYSIIFTFVRKITLWHKCNAMIQNLNSTSNTSWYSPKVSQCAENTNIAQH